MTTETIVAIGSVAFGLFGVALYYGVNYLFDKHWGSKKEDENESS